MKKTLKIVLISLGVLVVLLAIMAGVALVSLDSMVKAGVEKGGSYALKVPVTLDSADISVFGGSADLRGLSVANPEGYKAPRAVYFGEIRAGVEPGSLTKDVVVVPEVVIRGAEITIEGNLEEGSNIQRLLKNLDETLGASGGKPEQPTPADEKPGKKFVIRRLVIENAKVSVGATLLGGEAASVTLKQLEIKDIGTAGQPATMAEVTHKVLSSILMEASNVTGKVGSAIKGIASQAGVAASQIGEGVKETGKGLIEGVKGIFKKDGQ